MVVTGTLLVDINNEETEIEYEVNFHDSETYQVKVWPTDEHVMDEATFDTVQDKLEQLAVDDAVIKVERTIK